MYYQSTTPFRSNFPLYCRVIGTIPAGTTAAVEYKLASAGVWSNAMPLWRIEPSYSHSSPPETIVDAFAGTIFDLTAGETYDVRVRFYDGGRFDRRAYG